MNFCDLDQGNEILRKPFGVLAFWPPAGAGHCTAPRCLGAAGRGWFLLQWRCPKPSRAPQRRQGMLWKGAALNHVPDTTCRAIDAAGTGTCCKDGSALAVAGLCLFQVGSAQRWLRQGSGKAPHQLQRLPGQTQLEIPAEGQQRFLSLARVRGSGCGRCRPHGDGFVDGSAAAPHSQFPVPVSYRGDILPRLPQNEQTQPDPRLTLGALSVRSIARSGLTSSGAE